MCTKQLFLLVQVFVVITVQAQVNADEIQLVINTSRAEMQLHNIEQIRTFYARNHYNYVWLNNYANTKDLLCILQAVEELGLNKEEYQYDLIRSLGNNSFIRPAHFDSLRTEIGLTDAAIHFFNDIAYGNHKPVIGYNGLDYAPDCFDIPTLLTNALATNRLPQLVKELEPEWAGYQTLKDWLMLLRQSISDSTYKEVKITTLRTERTNQPLIDRLYYLGIIDTLQVNYTNAFIKAKVRSAQRLFNLSDDGVLHKSTLDALNTPIAIRVEELKLAINTVRWLRCKSMLLPVFIVNIPSANLLVIHKGNVLLQSKVIVGKKTTPTPTLASQITEVILYPYWTVPNKIASRELLPLIQRNPGYLEANNMQVLNKAGKIVNPAGVNWNALSPAWFPYTLRQSTGCDNSLGIVKLNFYSPYGVYLHDTPWKVLFNFNRRYFSHGCMRVEKALELAHFLLNENTIAIDTLVEKGCIRNQAPLPVPVKEKVPVFVFYNTAWFDSTGLVQFNDDIYRKLNLDQNHHK